MGRGSSLPGSKDHSFHYATRCEDSSESGKSGSGLGTQVNFPSGLPAPGESQLEPTDTDGEGARSGARGVRERPVSGHEMALWFRRLGVLPDTISEDQDPRPLGDGIHQVRVAPRRTPTRGHGKRLWSSLFHPPPESPSLPSSSLSPAWGPHQGTRDVQWAGTPQRLPGTAQESCFSPPLHCLPLPPLSSSPSQPASPSPLLSYSFSMLTI